MMDMEFENGSDMIVNTLLNTTDTREHVGEIESGIRIVKYWSDTQCQHYFLNNYTSEL